MVNNENEYINEEELEGSLASFKDMLKTNASKYFEVHEFEYFLEYYIENNDINNAKLAIKHAMAIHPKSYELYKKLTQVLILSEEYEKAIRITHQSLEKFGEQPDIDTYLVLGEAYLKTDRIAEAEKYFYKSLKVADDEFYDICYSIAVSFEQEELYKKAIKYFKLIAKENSNLLFDIAMSYYNIEDYNNAILYFDEYIDIYPFSVEAWFYKAKSYDVVNQHDVAVESFETALSIDPEYIPALYELAKIWIDKGLYTNALESYKEILEIDKNPTDTLWISLGDVYFNLEKYDNAYKMYLNTLKENNNNEEAYYCLSLVDIVRGDYQIAKENIQKAISINAQLPEFWVTFGNINQFLALEKESELAYEKAVKINPYFKLAWKSLIDFYYYSNKTEEAISTLKTSEKYIDISTEDYFKLSAFYLEVNNVDKAVSVLKKAVKEDSSQYSILYEYFPNADNYTEIREITHQLKNI